MDHRHAPWHDDLERCTEVGPTVCLRPTVHGGNPDVTESATGEMAGGPTEHLYGFIVAYDWPVIEPAVRTMPDGTRCWCVSDLQPHEGWIHALVCQNRRAVDPGYRLEGAVCVDPHGSVTWSMTGSLEGGDLTLTPSIQAYDSRDPSGRKPTIHGFVTNGVWVPA